MNPWTVLISITGLILLASKRGDNSMNVDLTRFAQPGLPGSGVHMHHETLHKFRQAENLYGAKFPINSAFRTTVYNVEVGGVAGSSHVKGRAIDIDTTGLNQKQVAAALVGGGFKRLGIGDTFIHVDDDPAKPSPAAWGYPKNADGTWPQPSFNPFEQPIII